MIKPKHSSIAKYIFDIYIMRLLKKSFHSIEVFNHAIATDKNVLLIANHSSWWDGFFVYFINKIYFKKNFHIVMLAEKLKSLWFFQKLGAIGIDKDNPKSLLNFFKFSHSLINDKSGNNLLIYFPQGNLLPWHTKPIEFMNGISRLYHKESANFQLVVCAIKIHFQDYQFPNVYIDFKYLDNQSLMSPSSIVGTLENLLQGIDDNIVDRKEGASIMVGKKGHGA